MHETLDIRGATGSSYRFRKVDPDQLPATAGNFLFVHIKKSGLAIVGCGAAGSLVEAGRYWGDAKGRGANGLFVRLNVAGVVRTHEFNDIVEGAHPEVVYAEG